MGRSPKVYLPNALAALSVASRMEQEDSQYSDGELSKCLDETADWSIVDKTGRLLATAMTLRHALWQVRLLLSAGLLPHLLIRASGRPGIVQEDQLSRICAR